MNFTEEMLAEDEKRWGARDVVTELGYCGNYMRDRKDVTNLDIRFYAYIMRKAHDMLKAQEPRVMKLGEIMKCGDAEIMYLETGAYEKDIKPAIFQPENTQEGYFCFVSGWKFSGFYHVDNYKINWRCWTSRPTYEQREAEPWQKQSPSSSR